MEETESGSLRSDVGAVDALSALPEPDPGSLLRIAGGAKAPEAAMRCLGRLRALCKQGLCRVCLCCAALPVFGQCQLREVEREQSR